MDWELILIMFVIVFLFGLLIIASISSDILKVAKWLGLGAIAGNTINNKINADASVKAGKKFRKKKFKTNIPVIDKTVEFISPETVEMDEEIKSSDYAEFQEYLKWKEMKSSKENEVE